MLELDFVKQYLRVDSDDENNLISSFIIMATEFVEDIMRRKINEFEIVPETVRQAVLLTIATFYENRQGGKDGLNTYDLIDMVRRLTFNYRRETF